MHTGPRALVWLVHSLCAHHLPSTSSNIPHCTHTSAHTPSLAALPHLDMPIHPCFPLPGGLLPQTSPSGTNYPMVGVLSMCPPHHFSQFPTSGHLCGPAWTRFFCLPGPSQLVHHLVHPSVHLCAPLHTSVHLCTPLCTSAHLCAPLCTLPHTSVHLHAPPCISVHPCATFALHFPGLVTLIGPSILTSDPFGYPGQLSPSATGHNAHPWTSVESSPNSVSPICPICFSLWACTTHIPFHGPFPACSPLPKRHVFSLCTFFPLFLLPPAALRDLSLKGGA